MRRHPRAVGFEHQPINANVPKSFPQCVRLSVRNRAIDAKQCPESNCTVGVLGRSRKAVKEIGQPLGSRFQHTQEFTVRLAAMKHDTMPLAFSKCELSRQAARLLSRGCEIPMEVEPDFTEGQDLRVVKQLRDLVEVRWIKGMGIVRMPPYHRKDLGVLVRQGHRRIARFPVDSNANESLDARFQGFSDRSSRVWKCLGVIEVAMGVDQAAHGPILAPSALA